MKLELKHLTPYFNHRLEVISNERFENEKALLTQINLGVDEDLVMIQSDTEEFDFFEDKLEKVKPILRPLKDLANEIQIGEKSFYPLGSLLIQKYPKWFVENNGSAKYTHITVDFSGRFASAFLTYQATHEIQIDSKYINNTSYLVFQKLLEWHFDVFGLIEKGLAIDINTLPQQ